MFEVMKFLEGAVIVADLVILVALETISGLF